MRDRSKTYFRTGQLFSLAKAPWRLLSAKTTFGSVALGKQAFAVGRGPGYPTFQNTPPRDFVNNFVKDLWNL
jgi:hypothetical protein